MKKINWSDIFMVIMIAAMTLAGVYFMEYDWIEEYTAKIWVTGELTMVIVWFVNRMIRFVERNIDLFKN